MPRDRSTPRGARQHAFGGLNVILSGDLWQLAPPRGTFWAMLGDAGHVFLPHDALLSRQEKAALSRALLPPRSRSILCITNRHARAMLVMPDTFSCHTMPFYLVKKEQLSAPLSSPPGAAASSALPIDTPGRCW